MRPTIPTTSTKLAPAKASLSKPKSKKMIANRGPTTTGVLKVQQMLEGTFVNSSDTMLYTTLTHNSTITFYFNVSNLITKINFIRKGVVYHH